MFCVNDVTKSLRFTIKPRNCHSRISQQYERELEIAKHCNTSSVSIPTLLKEKGEWEESGRMGKGKKWKKTKGKEGTGRERNP